MFFRNRAFFLIFLLIFYFISYIPYSKPQAASLYPVYAKNGVVSSSDRIASEVGVEILKKGGNAVDAAIAVALALAVTYPTAGNLGGGGFMLIRMADGKTTAIDYRETAPAKASRDMYLDREGKVIPSSSSIGYLAVGIPGTVAGLKLALEKYGTMKWQDLVEPAYRLAKDGFPVSYWLAHTLSTNTDLVDRFPRGVSGPRELLSKFPESKRIFLRDGNYYKVGEILKQPELAQTLERLQKEGPDEFYQGTTAQLIVKDMKKHGGIITLEDLKGYKPVVREALRGDYRGYEIITMPPPSSGGIALIEMLNILEQYDLKSLGFNSSQRNHLIIETMRRAFADRAEFLGDPGFVKVPIKGLISKNYASQISKSINLNKATQSQEIKPGQAFSYESDSTTHFSIVDSMGNAVANTYTLNGSYGSGATVTGAGFLLNNEMDDFTAKIGVPNDYGLIQGDANSITAGKRPLSSMTPTIVLKDGKLFLVIGSPGGPTIINTVLQVILNVIDHNMNVQQAIDAPRFHHQWLPDIVVFEPYGFSLDLVDLLKNKGHIFSSKAGYIGNAQGVMIDPQTNFRLGGSDSRGADARSAGY
ncbi:MAG: gamma-glutamyltransferase [Acidobacteria bacterium]|nr:gamma-glutamyltransferase [Acidobacteriota bacterium]